MLSHCVSTAWTWRTFLRLLFGTLKDQGVGFAPIVITFNDGFVRRQGESSREAIIRMIACQFLDLSTEEEERLVVCDHRKLLEHIDVTSEGKMVVLLIDELNQSGVPLDPETCMFLKDHFLDASSIIGSVIIKHMQRTWVAGMIGK